MNSLLTFLAGIGLLVGGLFIMRFGLTNIFSHGFQTILTRLTLTPLRGIMFGAVAAAVMQSSTALTLVTIGLISAEYLSFYAGLGIILGANIGTCSTVQLLSIPVPASLWVPIFVLSGIVGFISKKHRSMALAIIGLAGMFGGLSLINFSLSNFVALNTVVLWLETASHNPVYGIGSGIFLTFLFQSSSAATALLMALADQHLIDLLGAAYGVYGNNIGSCLPSLIVGLAAPLAAKRVAVAHFLLNLLGVIIFFPFTHFLTEMTTLLSGDLAGQVAILHTLFNVISSLAALAVIRYYAKLIIFLIR
ncbi:MAG: Na+/Picotransporter [Firmicutes bacterium]|nr:Na+/Picotransporter [Bacillota bacterium]